MSVLSKIAKEEMKLEMTPMIDVTFLLLIFFMCMIKFKTLEGKLSAFLPKDVGVNTSKADPKEKVEIKLTVVEEGNRLDPLTLQPWSGEGRFVYDKERLVLYQVGPRKTSDPKELLDRLRILHDSQPDRGATIDARKGIVYGDVVVVLDAAIQANFTDITFVGSFE